MLAIGGTMYAAWPSNAGYQSFSSFHGPRLYRPRDELVADPPAAVAPLDHVDPARPVAAVGVIVAGEQVAELVERQLLRVAEPRGEDLELGAVGVAAEDRAGVGDGQLAAVEGRHVEPAVADAEIEPPVGPEPQAVQVVAQEADVDAVPLVQQRAAIGPAVAVGVAELPEPGDARVPDVALPCQDAGADAGGRIVEPVGEDGGRVGPAVAVAVHDPPYPFVLDRHTWRTRSPGTSCTWPRGRRPSGRPGRRRASSCDSRVSVTPAL